MTLEQIKLKIGERVDDPQGTAYANRYEGIFISAMTDIIKAVSEDGKPLFSESEYPELVEPYTSTVGLIDGFGKVNYSILNAIFVRDVYSDPITVNVNNRISFQKKTLQTLEYMKVNPYLIPSTGEGFWAEKANAVYVLIGNDGRSPQLSFDRIKNPSSTTWGTGIDLETNLYYGRSFIEACIKRASEILKSEIGNE